jgi:hypothetical protein
MTQADGTPGRIDPREETPGRGRLGGNRITREDIMSKDEEVEAHSQVWNTNETVEADDD